MTTNGGFLGWRMFYREDLKPWCLLISSGIWSIYTGPPDAKINGYERVGRIIAGTAAVGFWLGVFFVMAAGIRGAFWWVR